MFVETPNEPDFYAREFYELWRELGVYVAVLDPIGIYAGEFIKPLTNAIDELTHNMRKYVNLIPIDYDIYSVKMFLAEYLYSCVSHPDRKVRAESIFV